MIRKSTIALVLCALLLALAAVPAGAVAPKYKVTHFKVADQGDRHPALHAEDRRPAREPRVR